MLFQDDCGGLEVQTRQGQFVRAEPVNGAIVMNIGDLLMRWSNGNYSSFFCFVFFFFLRAHCVDILKSNLHRVNLPPRQDRFTGDDRLTRARYSIPYFVSANVDSLIECFPSCVDKDHPAKYPPIVARDYTAMRFSVQYETKGQNGVAAA